MIFQKHGYRIGDWENIDGQNKDFGKYQFNGLYQKGLQRWADADGTAGRTVEQYQLSASAEQFYIGGATVYAAIRKVCWAVTTVWR